MPPRMPIVWILSIVLLATATTAQAFDWWRPAATQKGAPVVVCPLKFCCDDYVPKCPPTARGIDCFLCDDYCRKSPPHAVPVDCFLCDDYCRKTPPVPTCPPQADCICVPACSEPYSAKVLPAKPVNVESLPKQHEGAR